MRLQIVRIVPDDRRKTSELAAGEVVHHAVELHVEGEAMTFDVTLKAKVLGGFDASLLYGDEPLEELLRFFPAAQSSVLSAVGRFRRGERVDLPLDVDTGLPDATAHAAAH